MTKKEDTIERRTRNEFNPLRVAFIRNEDFILLGDNCQVHDYLFAELPHVCHGYKIQHLDCG
jgi:hypothetical protein